MGKGEMDSLPVVRLNYTEEAISAAGSIRSNVPCSHCPGPHSSVSYCPVLFQSTRSQPILSKINQPENEEYGEIKKPQLNYIHLPKSLSL